MQFLNFLFSTKVDVRIELDGEERRKRQKVKDQEGKVFEFAIFEQNENIAGKVQLYLSSENKYEHQGVQIELIGRIETFGSNSMTSDLFSLSQSLEPAGQIYSDASFPFIFQGVKKQFESYYGNSVRLRYILRATVIKQYTGDIVFEKDFFVQKQVNRMDLNSTVKMEVGLEDCFHIQLDLDKQKYHLTDVIQGSVYFLLVRI